MDRKMYFKKKILEMGEPLHVKRKLIFQEPPGCLESGNIDTSDDTTILQSIENAEQNLSTSVLIQVRNKLSELDSAASDSNKSPPLDRRSDTNKPFNNAPNESVAGVSACETNVTEVLEDNRKHGQKRKQTSRERAKGNRKSYYEFISDNEDPFFTDGDSSSWQGSSDSDKSEKDINKKKTKKKKLSKKSDGKPSETNDNIETVGEKGYRKKTQNTKKKMKEAKQKGEEYIKSNGSIRKRREMKPNPCTGKKCGNDCQSISDERRLSLFKHFWSLTSEKQRDWLVHMSRKTDIKRKRNKDSGRRIYSFEYYINHNEDRRKVCQQFLLNTLDITQTYVYYTLTNASQGCSKDDLRGKTIPANKTKEQSRQSVYNFIKNLPALPSHYCRKDSTKLYLPVEFKNQKKLYRIYKDQKTSEGIDVVSEKIFLNIFKSEFNIGFHVPKKDKCIKCMKFDALNTEESKTQKAEHLKEKEASKERYSQHRELAQKRNDVLCTSFDLQKVLNTPHGESMLLYYSRKYAMYNLCFYENGTRDGFCYIWGESEGKRGGNEISSIIQKYIKLVDARGTVKHLILYSDSCPGQNKNRIVLAVVHNALKQCDNLTSVQMNYLLPGHTEMSVDSMHSVIEGSVKNTIVWAPSQWITVCQLARKEPRPYNVNYLDHTDFQGYDEFSDKYFRGNLTGKISKLRIVTFKKSNLNVMAVKYSMLPDAEEEIIPINGATISKIIKHLYAKTLPITQKKYEDLAKLCENFAIPRAFHKEYLTLPHVLGVDSLVETDIED
ncbi:hypothetical protein ACJJTC_001895 [Scirpophaga incertulas]